MLWALAQFILITRIPVRSEGISDSTGLVSGSNDEATTRRLIEIYTAIYEGAESFLRAEYTICAWFILVFTAIIFVLVSWGTGWDFARGTFTALSFVLGACTSIREFGGIQYFFFNFHWLSSHKSYLFLFAIIPNTIHYQNSLWLPRYEGSRLLQRQDHRQCPKVWLDSLLQHRLPVS